MRPATYTVIARKEFYWMCQLGGWLLYILLNAFFIYLSGSFTVNVAFRLVLVFFMGVLLTQGLRWMIIRFRWLQLPPFLAAIRILGMNIIMAMLVTVVQAGLAAGTDETAFSFSRLSVNLPAYTFVFFFWSVLYFLVFYIQNYKKTEINFLKWQATMRETELNRLKSQINPHFMFNAMNSIRALIDENPGRAKDAVTQLSALLRNTLQVGKQKIIPFAQELEMIRDYIAIESARFEERLSVEWKIAPGSEESEVPPLMVQTLVENAIKHGIAKLPAGGKLCIETKISNDGLRIFIRNSGKYNAENISETGFGIRNTKERLTLLYGERASFSISNENGDTVLSELFIPEKTNT